VSNPGQDERSGSVARIGSPCLLLDFGTAVAGLHDRQIHCWSRWSRNTLGR
jgi:hypothetical protein